MDNMYPTSLQERQLLACRSMMAEEPIIPMTIVESEEPLEKTRLYGPFDVEVIAWVHKMWSLVTMGWDSEGRQYIEY